MDAKRLANTLELIACDIGARPPAPGPSELAPFVTGIQREPGILTFQYAPEAQAKFELFVAAERMCCASLGWDLVAGPQPGLQITASPAQLDALQEMFAPVA